MARPVCRSARRRRFARSVPPPAIAQCVAPPFASCCGIRVAAARPLTACVAAGARAAPCQRVGAAPPASPTPRRHRARTAGRCSRRRAATPREQLPIILRARELRGRPDLDAEAERRRRVPPRHGRHPRRPAELRPGRGPRPRHRQRRRQPRRQRLQRPRAAAAGRALRRLLPRARPTASRAPAPAARRRGIDFIDDQRAVATDATYTSCRRRRRRRAGLDPAGRASSRIDNETNEGVARDAVLRFYGVPILASPVLSFPLTDERKSGLLPPSFGLDSRSGFQAAIPYYWNIAPEPRRHLHARRRARGAARRSTPSSATSSRATPARSSCKLLPRDRADAAARATRLRFGHEGAAAVRRLRAAAGAARLRRRLLEGLPARADSADAAPAADRPAAAAGRSATGRPTPGCSAGRCCRPPTRRPASTVALRALAAGRHALRRAAGAAASRSRSRPSSTASPTPTTTTSPSRQTGDARACARQHQPAVRLARLDR